MRRPWVAVLVSPLLAAACQPSPPPAASAPPTAAPTTAPSEEALPPAPEATPLPADIAPIVKPFKGDLDGMTKRRVIRVLTVQSPIFYFVDRGREAGLTYETIKDFEKDLNAKLGNKVVTVHVIAIPVARDQLLPRLVAGEGDLAAAALTITPQRKAKVDFSTPIGTGVREVLVTGPAAPPIATVDDLSGKEVYVRRSSSYAEHIAILNARFKKEGKRPRSSRTATSWRW
jgi:membrane-bound lytic murein transglycosylase MltF